MPFTAHVYAHAVRYTRYYAYPRYYGYAHTRLPFCHAHTRVRPFGCYRLPFTDTYLYTRFGCLLLFIRGWFRLRRLCVRAVLTYRRLGYCLYYGSPLHTRCVAVYAHGCTHGFMRFSYYRCLAGSVRSALLVYSYTLLLVVPVHTRTYLRLLPPLPCRLPPRFPFTVLVLLPHATCLPARFGWVIPVTFSWFTLPPPSTQFYTRFVYAVTRVLVHTLRSLLPAYLRTTGYLDFVVYTFYICHRFLRSVRGLDYRLVTGLPVGYRDLHYTTPCHGYVRRLRGFYTFCGYRYCVLTRFAVWFSRFAFLQFGFPYRFTAFEHTPLPGSVTLTTLRTAHFYAYTTGYGCYALLVYWIAGYDTVLYLTVTLPVTFTLR